MTTNNYVMNLFLFWFDGSQLIVCCCFVVVVVVVDDVCSSLSTSLIVSFTLS